jgi:hypothetical protein
MAVSRLLRSTVIGVVVSLVVTVAAWTPAARPQVVGAAGPVPVAEWTFDEGIGATANDVVGSLDGTLVGGASWVTTGAAQGSGAIAFDGVDDAVTVTTSSTLEPSGSFTLMFWVKSTDQINTSNQPILQKNFNGCDVGSSWSADQGLEGIFGQVRLAGYPNSTGAESNGYLPTWNGEWHKFAMVVDPSGGLVSAWIDGHKQVADFTVPLNLNYGASGRIDDHLRIGGPGVDCPNRKPFHGAVDDLKIFATALTDAQVLAEMPVFPTTTTVQVVQNQVATTVYGDAEFFLQAFMTPPPPAGDTEFYLSKDGGPETLFATSPIVEGGIGWSFTRVGPGVLVPGSYSYRATWLGASNWLTSTSDPTTFTVVGRPIEMTLAATPDADVPGGGSTLAARIRTINPALLPTVTGPVEFHDVTGGGDVLLGSSSLAYIGNPSWNQATFNVSGLATGLHTYEARFAGTNEIAGGTAQATVTVGKQASGAWLDVTPNPVLNTAGATAAVYISSSRKGLTGHDIALPAATGTVAVKRVSTGAVLGTTPVNGPGPYSLLLPVFPSGTVGLVAEYSGDANFDASTSAPFDLSVQSDVVDATGVTIGYTTFYPAKDGYRDTLPIKGVRNELASVAVRVYNSSNKLVKSFSVASGTGPYSVSWTGRNSAGTMLATGTYRVVQTLTDGNGIHLAVTKSVVLSAKKLYYYSKTVTKLGTGASSVGTSGSGRVLKYSDGSIKLEARGGWVGVGWQLTLPSAAVYSSLSIGAYGSTGAPLGYMSAQNFTWCSYSSTWDISCFDRSTAMHTTTSWATRSVSASANRHGRYVRIAVSQYIGSTKVYKVRAVVKYGVLK